MLTALALNPVANYEVTLDLTEVTISVTKIANAVY